MPELLAPADYQPALAVLATRCLARLRLWLPQARLEEVGASSIPGAWSKGDLDLMAAVPATEFEARREALVAHGYVEKQGTLRTPELCMLEWREGPEAHALQLVAVGSEFEALFLTLRDRLRASPALLAQYNAVKQAHRADSDADYRAAKALFIAAVLAGSTLAQAEDFAAVLAAEQAVWEALRQRGCRGRSGAPASGLPRRVCQRPERPSRSCRSPGSGPQRPALRAQRTLLACGRARGGPDQLSGALAARRQ